MKSNLLKLLTIIAALMTAGASRAQVTTVYLSDDDREKFTVSAGDLPTGTVELKFRIAPLPLADGTVIECVLRVVPTASNTTADDQDVSIFSGDKQVAQWHAYSETIKPFDVKLKPETCKSGSVNVFTLKTFSPHTAWVYHGGKAKNAADRPRRS